MIPLYTPKKVKKKRVKQSIVISPSNGEVASYRNFISGHSPRAISYGYPEGMNLLFSEEHCNVQQMWKESFMDGGLHWTGRGIGTTQPLGEQAVLLNTSDAPSLMIGGKECAVKLWKIQLDDKRRPTFYYRAEGHPAVYLQDYYEPYADKSGFMRTVTLVGEGVTQVKLPVKQKPAALPQVSCTQLAGDHLSYELDVLALGQSFNFQYKW